MRTCPTKRSTKRRSIVTSQCSHHILKARFRHIIRISVEKLVESGEKVEEEPGLCYNIYQSRSNEHDKGVLTSISLVIIHSFIHNTLERVVLALKIQLGRVRDGWWYSDSAIAGTWAVTVPAIAGHCPNETPNKKLPHIPLVIALSSHLRSQSFAECIRRRLQQSLFDETWDSG
jgi:hypothetical protein